MKKQIQLPELSQMVSDLLQQAKVAKIIFSGPNRTADYHKQTLMPKKGKTGFYWQVEASDGQKVFHTNYYQSETAVLWLQQATKQYKQAQILTAEQDYQLYFQKEGLIRLSGKAVQRPIQAEEHNRSKNYLLREGEPVDFLLELGIMTAGGMVSKDRFDKFKQINRYLEIVTDCLPRLPNVGTLRIVDFGCGKSYLTFALYWLLAEKMQREVEIIGLDLKTDVIEHCEALARKLHYTGLHFEQGDIAVWQNDRPVDLVVSLHACDTATDAALTQAILWQAKVILAVPCCQHELAAQLQSETQLAMLQHGILRERLASLLTDALRAAALEVCGYTTQVMEFIDLEHTPKNLLIKAIKSQKTTDSSKARLQMNLLMQSYGIKEWTMLKLLAEHNIYFNEQS
ncbi:MAG: SAM-dependent methyltransferase [Negativicutes bacterium]|nr:SAM-dependent methyltransferase [Negativicutes bacterium]